MVCSKLLPVDPVLAWNTLSDRKGDAEAEASHVRTAAGKRNRNLRARAIARRCSLIFSGRVFLVGELRELGSFLALGRSWLGTLFYSSGLVARAAMGDL